MKLTWWDDEHSKLIAELEQGETFMEYSGPCSVQIPASELTALDTMDPKPTIEDPLVPKNLSPEQQKLHDDRKAAAEESRKREDERKAEAAAAKPAKS